MSIPTWVPGEVLASADVNTWFVPLAVVKSSDTGRASTTTLTADPDLQLALAASSQYQFDMRILYKGGTNGSSDMQFSVSGPTGMGGHYWMMRHQISSLTLNDVLVNSFPTTVNIGTNGTGNPIAIFVSGCLTTGGTAGTIAFNWAQNTSNATATTVMASSYICARRIG